MRASIFVTSLALAACSSVPTTDVAATDAHDTPHDIDPNPQGLIPLYAGPAATAQLSMWDAARPRPVVGLAVRRTAQIQTLTMLQIGRDGTIGALAADDVYAWGWGIDVIDAPHAIYDGPLDGTLPDWDASQRRPLVVMAHTAGSDTWSATMLEIRGNGTFGSLNADRIIVYGWDDGAIGAPTLRFEGNYDSTVHIPAWDPGVIAAHVAMSGQNGSRYVTSLEIRADGSLGPIAAETVSLWDF